MIFHLESDLFSHRHFFADFLFALFSVVLINLTSLFGTIILPFRNKFTFKWIFILFIGLGQKTNRSFLIFILLFFSTVETLLGTNIFHLMPIVSSNEFLLHQFGMIFIHL